MASLYQGIPSRLRLLSLPITATVTVGSGLAAAILATQAADQKIAGGTSGSVSSNGWAPVEALQTTFADMTGDSPAPIEAGATVRSGRSIMVEKLILLPSDMPDPVEWSGALQVVGDARLALEGTASTRSDASARGEAAAALLAETVRAVEWLASGRAVTEARAEMLAAIEPGVDGRIEWLGTGATASADAMLPLEWQQSTPALLLSLESGPGRLRLLATPGRVRLVRRN